MKVSPRSASPSIPDRSPAHRQADLTPSWVIVGLAMGPAVALGLGRFAYALLLPPMRADLGWNFAQAGALNTANAAGYLLGAVVAALVGRRMGDKRVFVISLVLTALAVGASGLTADFTALLALRVAAGFTGALAFVCGAGLASAAAMGGSKHRAPISRGLEWASQRRSGGASLAGNGWMARRLACPWRACACGHRIRLASGAARPRAPDNARAGSSPRVMACTLVAYGLFGAGYIAYATFIIAYLRGAEGFTSGDVTRFWSIFGLSSIAAAFAWGRVLGRLRGGWGLAATLGVLTVGTAAPLVWSTPAGAYLSAILFGGSFLAVLAAVASFARRAFKPHAVTGAIGTLTVVFGIGQCIGPVLSGALADGPSGLKAGLWLSVCILAVGALVAAFQSEPAEPR
jgi:predicted MFS family arabinose efflux permease